MPKKSTTMLVNRLIIFCTTFLQPYIISSGKRIPYWYSINCRNYGVVILTRHKRAVRIISHPVTLPYNALLALYETESLKLQRRNFQQKFFHQVCHLGNCLAA